MRACKYNVKGGVLALLLVLCCFSQNTAQQIWIVSNEPGYSPAQFNNIQEAIDSASHGDLIYVHGTSTPYGGNFSSNKKLHIVGPGFWKSENGIQTTNVNPANFTGDFTLLPGSDSSIVEGIIVKEFLVHSSNVVIRHNWVTPFGVKFLNNPSNISVYSNYLSWCVSGSGVNINVFNNICIATYIGDSGPYWQNSASNSDCLFQSNSCNGSANGYSIDHCVVRNNIFNNPNFSISGSTVIEHNIFVDDDVTINGVPTDSLGNGNIDSVQIANIWDFSHPAPDGDFLLTGTPMTNPAFGAGVNGEDCGAFGGSAPYRLSGIVQIPSISYMLIPPIGDTTNMLNVKIQAKSN